MTNYHRSTCNCTYMYIILLHVRVCCILTTVKECDRLSLVTYDTQVYLDFGLTVMNRANKDKTKALIQKLRDGSCTNLCGGLVKGTHLLPPCQSHRGVEEYIPAYIFLTKLVYVNYMAATTMSPK